MDYNFTKTDLKYYRQRKIPSLLGITLENENISIHSVINAKVKYDPFNMKNKGTVKHNKINLLRSKYKRFLKGGYLAPTRDEFKQFLMNDSQLRKYFKRFT